MRRTSLVSLLVVAAIGAPVSSAHAEAFAPSGPSGPILRPANVRVAEGDAGFTTVLFTITASRPARASVDYTTKDGTATAGLDYVAESGTLHFTAKKTTKRIAVEVIGDELVEGDETFHIRLTNAVGARIPDRTGRATITDDDGGSAGGSISVSDATANEGQNAAFVVSLSAVFPASVTVDYATSDGSATAPADYQAKGGTLTFDPGQTVKQVVVPVAADALTEVDETFALNLSNAVGDTIADGVAIGTITDDDTPGISVANASATEGNTGTVSALFSVTLSLQSSQPVTVQYATADGSATAPADYQATSGTLAFDPGQNVKQIVVPVVGDTLIESTEVFSLNLSGPTNATLADGTAQGTITDNDTVSISVANASVTEGNTGTVGAVFNVTLSTVGANVVTVDYATADGSATAPDDYLVTGGSLTFNPGETIKQIVVPVVGDTAIETTEVFSLNLSDSVNATLADPSAQGTITDNDTVSISIGAASVTEANAGTKDCVFTVTLSAVSGSTVTVDFTTADGSATAPADYLATAGTLTFAPGVVSKQIVVQTVGDLVVEANETFSVNLSNPGNATIAGSGFGLGTITNND
jgi:Calx-beta domain-containing protein